MNNRLAYNQTDLAPIDSHSRKNNVIIFLYCWTQIEKHLEEYSTANNSVALLTTIVLFSG